MTSDEQKIAEYIIACRTRLLSRQPFYAHFALFLKVSPLPQDFPALDLVAAATDGRTLYFNTAKVAQMKDVEVEAMICHEVQHILRNHLSSRRIGHRDRVIWNMAGDHVINNDLVRTHLQHGALVEVPSDWLCDRKYFNWTTEAVYEDLLLEAPKVGVLTKKGVLTGGGMPCGGMLEVESESEAKELEDEWTNRLVSVRHHLKNRGLMPGWADELVDSVVFPKIDLYSMLYNFLKPAKIKLDWIRPNLSLLPYKIFMPIKRGLTLHNLVLAVDTSGSVSADELAYFRGVFSRILYDFPDLTGKLVHVDYSIQKVFELSDFAKAGLNSDSMRRFYGRGGTSFEPVFKLIEEKKWDPSCLIYFTDGEAPWPTQEPSYPVFWILTQEKRPPWGRSTVLKL